MHGAPCSDAPRNVRRKRAVGRDFREAALLHTFKRRAGGRRAGAVEAVELSVLPDHHEGVGPETVAGGLHERHRRRHRDGSIDGIPALQENLKADRGSGGVPRAGHAVRGIDHRAAGGMRIVKGVKSGPGHVGSISQKRTRRKLFHELSRVRGMFFEILAFRPRGGAAGKSHSFFRQELRFPVR